MILFYQPYITMPFHTLDREESGHCIRVLRMKAGDEVSLTDGRGLLCHARISDPDPKRCTVQVTGTRHEKERAPFRLHLAVAPTKNTGRYEWFLEKATEIGVDEITPLICGNSERNSVNLDRLVKISVAAMKQSLKPFLPILHKPVNFSEFTSKTRKGQSFVAHVSEEHRNLLKQVYIAGNDCTVLIGPEGDFTEEEVAIAIDRGFEPVSLGHSRLRTETAALAACHTVQLIND